MRIARVVTAGMLVLGACGDDAAPQPEGPTTLEGVVIEVESSGLNEVTSFQLRHDDEETTVYIIEDHDYGFPLGHLNEHLSSGDPVIVEGEIRDDRRLYAESIEDA